MTEETEGIEESEVSEETEVVTEETESIELTAEEQEQIEQEIIDEISVFLYPVLTILQKSSFIC